MDQPGLDPAEHEQALHGLARINALSDSAGILWPSLLELARWLVLVNDLERGPLGWMLAWLGTRLLSRSRIVHVDGPLSVEGAFTCAEVRALARRAGLDGATLTRRWPCRFLLAWRRPGVTTGRAP